MRIKQLTYVIIFSERIDIDIDECDKSVLEESLKLIVYFVELLRLDEERKKLIEVFSCK